jgi:hypothetical protein
MRKIATVEEKHPTVDRQPVPGACHVCVVIGSDHHQAQQIYNNVSDSYALYRKSDYLIRLLAKLLLYTGNNR